MKKTKNIYQQFILTCLTLFTWTACVQDDFNMPGDVVEGKPITVSLNFSAIPETDVVVTRAGDNSYSDLSRVAIFIYSGDHFQELVRTANGTLTIERNTANDDGVYYKATFKTTSGTKNLLAVANTSTVSADGAIWGSLQSIAEQAQQGKLTFEQLKESIISLRDQNDNRQPIQVTANDQMLMSGWNEGVVFDTGGNVTYKGNNVGDKNVILRLDRSLARITFRIKYKEFSYEEGAVNRIFTPTSYKVYNVPVNSYLGNIQKNPNQELDDFTNYAESNVSSVEDGYYSFEFYMPENIYPIKDGVTDYHDRDKWKYEGHEGATPEEKTSEDLWSSAPQYSTFVVIKGNYEETKTDKEYTGTVEYTIHLGDFSKTTGSMGNYSVERNCNYTYTVTVLNVENIVVEATKEDTSEYQEGSEGSIYDYTQSDYAYHLDAHYEQVYLQYNLSEIAEEVERNEDYRDGNITLDQAIADALVLTIQSEAMDYEHPETESEPYSVHNKRGTLKPYQIYVDAKGTNDDEEAATRIKETVLSGNTNRDGQSGFDYKWVEFWPQTGSTLAQYPGVPDWSRDDIYSNKGNLQNTNVYGGDETNASKYLMDVYDVIVEMGKAVKEICNNGSLNGRPTAPNNEYNRQEKKILVTTNEEGDYVARFTAFVNEYYYYRHPLTDEKITSWSLFTNKMPREMIVALSTDVSNDGNSTYSVLYSYISQLSIQTFYNSRVSSINGFGIETYNETPLFSFGNNNFDGTRSDGRTNQIQLLGGLNGGYYDEDSQWDTYINASNNGWTSSVTSERASHKLLEDAYKQVGNYYNRNRYAYYACMSRNRDLNGDGRIDRNEVRWYLASLNEYIRIGIGSSAISNAAQIYTGDKMKMEKGSYPTSYINDGALYYTSSSNQERIYWAVERGSFGSDGDAGGDGIKKPIRCIRLLPGSNGNVDISTVEGITSDATFDYYTDDGNYILNFEGRLVDALYRERTNTTLDEHDEDDPANSFYRGIIVSKHNIRTNGEYGDNKGFELSQIVNLGGDETNPCAEYHEEGDGDVTWRVPNLVEFSAMNAVLNRNGLSDILIGRNACGTKFSNEDVRLGFYSYIVNNTCIITCPGGVATQTWDEEYYVRCVRDVPEDYVFRTN